MEMIYCACGCGKQRPKYRSNKPYDRRICRFIKGHTNKGKHLTTSHKENIGIANGGHIMSESQRKLLSKIAKKAYASGERVNYWKGKKMRPDIIEKMHNATRGKPSKNRGTGLKRRLGNHGYIYIFIPNLPVNSRNYVLEHRYVMSQHIGRELYPEEDVHHIDGDKTNNDIDNLILFPSRSAHLKFHNRK